MRLARGCMLGFGLVAAACAPTNGPVTPPVQVLIVLDSLDGLLRIIPVDSTQIVHTLALNTGTSNPTALALRGQIAAISAGDSVEVLDLATGHTICGPGLLSSGGPVVALAFDANGQGYAATPLTSRVTNFTSRSGPSCGAGSATLPGGANGFAAARGLLYAIVGNRSDAPNRPRCIPSPSSPCASWLKTPPIETGDSIPVNGPGNAMSGVFAPDNFLYVINAGDLPGSGTLSQVDPAQKSGSLGPSYPGFGTRPAYIATDGIDRVFVASAADGLMIFNVRTHQIDRGANNPVALGGTARGLATDDLGRVYALLTGSCTATGIHGSVNVIGTDLTSQHFITVGRCPIAIGVSEIPAALYHFDN